MVTTRSTYAVFSAALSRRLSRSRRLPRSLRSLPAVPAPVAPRRWGPAIRRSSSLKSRQRCGSSQSQPTLAGTVGDRRDTAVVAVATTVEHDGLDAGSLRTLGEELADLAGLGRLVAVEGPQVRLHRGGRRQGLAHGVVDDLDEDVTARARHHHARTQRGAVDLLADAQVATTASGALALRALDDHCHGLLTSLSDLAADVLAGVPHALALVRVGLAQLADVRGDLAVLLLVDALDAEAQRAVGGEADALGGLHRDGVAVAERELQVGTLGHHAVAGADDLELLLVA